MRKRIAVYTLATGDGGAAKSSAVVAERLSRNHDVSLIVASPVPASRWESYFAVDLSRVRLISLNIPVQRARLRAMLEPTYRRQIQAYGFDLFINKHPLSRLRCPAPRGIYLCMFPREVKGEPRRDPTRGPLQNVRAAFWNRVLGMSEDVLDSYQVIAANSCYTAEWIERLWRRKSTVVYSSCEDMGPPALKEKIILHAGRFTSARRSDYKHQRTLLEVFRRMTSLHQQGWRLNFAGTLETSAAAGHDFADLTGAADGLPVEFYPSASFETLRDLYRRASIYWHATGFGSSPELHPAKQEHFGMTVVEAMSAGAVPVALNSGGPRETVQHDVSGFLWDGLVELQRYTELLASNPALLQQFGERAVTSSVRFHRAAFEERIESLVELLLRSHA